MTGFLPAPSHILSLPPFVLLQQDLPLLSSSHSAFPFWCFRILLPFLSPSHSMQTSLLSCSLSSAAAGLSSVTALLWLQLCLLLFPHFPALGFSLLLVTQESSIRKRFIFSSSENSSGAGRGGESAPGSSWLHAGQLSVVQSRAALGLCLAGVSAWERQARECGAGHAGAVGASINVPLQGGLQGSGAGPAVTSPVFALV